MREKLDSSVNTEPKSKAVKAIEKESSVGFRRVNAFSRPSFDNWMKSPASSKPGTNTKADTVFKVPPSHETMSSVTLSKVSKDSEFEMLLSSFCFQRLTPKPRVR